MDEQQKEKTELSADWLTQHIRQNIPLADTMAFEVASLSGHAIEVRAPLAPNINVHGTGFAGSLYSLSVLTAWGFTSALLLDADIAADVVVSKAEIRYRKPVNGDIQCVCECQQDVSAAFVNEVSRAGKGRLSLAVKIGDAGEALLSASMVAIKHR